MNGNWGGRVIEGDRLTWKDRITSVMSLKSPKEFSVVRSGKKYEARLEADGDLLFWNDGGVWLRDIDVSKIELPEKSNFPGSPEELRLELARLEREARERALERMGILQHKCGAWNRRTPDGKCSECRKDQGRDEDVYVGKPHLPPSWNGGGWGGPKEGHDKDECFMLRYETRDLPNELWKAWNEKGRFMNKNEQKMVEARSQLAAKCGQRTKSNAKKKDKRKVQKVKKDKKKKKDKKGKKTKKDKSKKAKKDKKKRKRSSSSSS